MLRSSVKLLRRPLFHKQPLFHSQPLCRKQPLYQTPPSPCFEHPLFHKQPLFDRHPLPVIHASLIRFRTRYYPRLTCMLRASSNAS
jgi:hypothetical protein